jgi:ABC-type polysaccharide/polyol phosphate export permease
MVSQESGDECAFDTAGESHTLAARPAALQKRTITLAGLVTLVFAQLIILLLFLPMAGIAFHDLRWVLLACTALLGSTALAGLNLGAALLINSVQGYHAIMGLVLFPLWIVSGAMFPIPQEGVLSLLSQLNPMTHIAALFREALIPELTHSRVLEHLGLLLIQAILGVLFTRAMTHHRKANHV